MTQCIRGFVIDSIYKLSLPITLLHHRIVIDCRRVFSIHWCWRSSKKHGLCHTTRQRYEYHVLQHWIWTGIVSLITFFIRFFSTVVTLFLVCCRTFHAHDCMAAKVFWRKTVLKCVTYVCTRYCVASKTVVYVWVQLATRSICEN